MAETYTHVCAWCSKAEQYPVLPPGQGHAPVCWDCFQRHQKEVDDFERRDPKSQEFRRYERREHADE